MSRWFRFYNNAVHDPKVQRLPGEKFKAWINLLCIASENDGILPDLRDLCHILRLSETRVSCILNDLCEIGLLDPVEVENAPMSYEPHNWAERQFKSDTSNQRVSRYRQRKRNVTPSVTPVTCNVTPAVTVTAPEQSRTDTESEQSRKKETREVALVSVGPSEFEIFWAAWPEKVGKADAVKKFASARKRASLEEILGGVHRYILHKPPERPWLNPATFLNQNRWEDQPAKVEHGKTKSGGSLIETLNRAIERSEQEDRHAQVLEIPFLSVPTGSIRGPGGVLGECENGAGSIPDGDGGICDGPQDRHSTPLHLAAVRKGTG